jgi:hypothetical protein
MKKKQIGNKEKKDWGDNLVFQQILRNFAIVMKNPLRPP